MAVIEGPRCNRRVTCDPSPSNARSESAIAINPLDPLNMVAASKRFTNPSIYGFSNAAYATFDGGLSWVDNAALVLPAGWAGTSDPVVAWDNMGNAYLVVLPFGPGSATDFVGPVLGMAVYKSADGGRTWGSPTLIHAASGDDKQWASGDIHPGSPFYGNVYAAWDNGSQLAFARTLDHGASWIGLGANPAGTTIPGATDSFSPEIAVAGDGSLYIFWQNGQSGSQIKYVKSTDGGNSFSAPAVAATGITSLRGALPETDGWPHFIGATFRVLTLPTSCCGSGQNVVVAWADHREGRSRIYYRRSSNGGSTWQGAASGQALLTGANATPNHLHDFHPQIIATPNGEIGCAFYEFGPAGSGEFPPNLIHVILAVSTNNGASFDHRVTVTDRAWDPAVDAPLVHGNPNVTFIGEYFGLDASRLGFFPLWTDTRTGVQEIFAARVAVNPADLYIRDSSSDVGDVPSPGFHWEAPDLIVRRAPDGNVTFVNEDLLRDGATHHYVYARVSNRGTNTARNVRLAITVGNYPSLQGLPGTEFRYPQDWYSGDWASAPLQASHLYLGESTPMDIPAGASNVVIGPVFWNASDIPDPASWHPCLLAEVRADNDDHFGGTHGCDVDADPDDCVYGSYFWGNNNISQRNLNYASVTALMSTHIELPFIVGSLWSKARKLEVIVDKGRELAKTPMTLRMEALPVPAQPSEPECHPAELVFTGRCRVVVRVNGCEVGEIQTTPGTVWRPHCPPIRDKPKLEVVYGGEKVGDAWTLTQPRSAVAFEIATGERRKMTLSFSTPTTLKPGTKTYVRIYQRNGGNIITGSVIIELTVPGDEDKPALLTGSALGKSKPIQRTTKKSTKTRQRS